MASQEIQCPHCGRTYLVEVDRWKNEFICTACNAPIEIGQDLLPQQTGSPDPMLPPTATTTPSPNQGHAPAQSSAQQPVQTGGAVTNRMYERQGNSFGCLLVAIFVAIGVVGFITMLVVYGPTLMSQGDSDGESTQSDPRKETRAEIVWVDASEQASKLRNMQVRITRVQFGEVRGRDESKQLQVSEGQKFLQVFVELRNRGAKTDYLSWYGNEFEGEEEYFSATLRDQDDNLVPMNVFTDVKKLAGHTATGELVKNQRLRDVIIFALEEDMSISDIEELYLTLPGHAFDINGFLYFRIPGSMINTGEGNSKGGLIKSPLLKNRESNDEMTDDE